MLIGSIQGRQPALDFSSRADGGVKMILVIGTLRLPPENLSRARDAMRAMIAASRAESGCLHYSYAEDVLEPGLIHVKEIWSSRAALQSHFQSGHLSAWRASWPALKIFDRDLTLHEIGAPEPI
jgi:quinol monooxygenase YgiN